jgi:hypothetical protein
LKKKNSKKATVIALYDTDLGLVLNWLRLKKVITSAGEKREIASGYAVAVKSKVSKSELNTIVKNRFGSFAKVI